MKMPITIPTLAQARFTATTIWAAIKWFVIGGLALALLGALIVQTVRLDGFRLWPVSVTGWIDRATNAEAALEAANAAKVAYETKSATKAKEIDDNAKSEIIAVSGPTEQFIAAGGVQRQGTTCGSRQNLRPADPVGTSEATELDATAPPTETPLTTGLVTDLVTVYADDVRICTENTIKAEAAHDFALSLEQANKAQ